MARKFIEVDEMTQMILEKLVESENAKPREIDYDTDPKPYEVKIATKWQEGNDALRFIASTWLLRGALQDGYAAEDDEGNDVVRSALIRSLDDAEAAIERVMQATAPESPQTDEVPDLVKLLQALVDAYKTGSLHPSLLMLQAEGGGRGVRHPVARCSAQRDPRRGAGRTGGRAMSIKMSCLVCGAEKDGEIAEVIDWDRKHREVCTQSKPFEEALQEILEGVGLQEQFNDWLSTRVTEEIELRALHQAIEAFGLRGVVGITSFEQLRERMPKSEPRRFSQVSETMIRNFKMGWHQADMEGDTGNRVKRGLQAVLDEIYGDEEP